MDDIGVHLLLLLLVLAYIDITSGELCTEVYGYSHTAGARTFHCSFGCCGPDFDQYCCVSHAGVIVGIVFACIFGIAFLSACVCCFIKHHGARGRVVRPTQGMVSQAVGNGAATTHTTTNVFIVPSGTGPPAYSSTAYNPFYFEPGSTPGAPPSAYPMMPPAYDVASAPPPAYASPPPPPGYEDISGGKSATRTATGNS